MMKFESDLAPATAITDLPMGTPDLLDIWFEETLMEEGLGDWLELTFDPDL